MVIGDILDLLDVSSILSFERRLTGLQREIFLRGRQIHLLAGPRGQSHLRVIRRGRPLLVTRADLAAEEASGQGRPPGTPGQGLLISISVSQTQLYYQIKE